MVDKICEYQQLLFNLLKYAVAESREKLCRKKPSKTVKVFHDFYVRKPDE